MLERTRCLVKSIPADENLDLTGTDQNQMAMSEELGNGGRVPWVSGRPGEAPAYAGTDFIIARDGRIAALYLFFDKLP